MMPPSSLLRTLYRDSLSLLTDLYQLTMAYGYWKLGVAEREAVFCMQFRTLPFHGGYAVAAGLEQAVEYLTDLHFDAGDCAYLATLTGEDGRPLFEAGFLEYLGSLRFGCDVDAIPEGTVVFPFEPLVRLRGPVLHCQLAETAVLNIVNFQTLIATKAARICQAARWDPVLEFGLRRAQGFDGGLSAARAAFIGGCAATSNVLAGKLIGIPVKGTHAHSWVMFFGGEVEAFDKYAEALPNNCVFLVDTYDTHEGVRHAIEAGRRLRDAGHRLLGIRLDSGDLAYLSVEARRMLDEAGFPDAQILASNELDEHVIASLIDQGAKIAVWGVGTRLDTAYDQPALGGVYKLTVVQEPDGAWSPRVKSSEQTAKSSIPGILQVRRYREGNYLAGDAIYDELTGIGERVTIVDPADPARRKALGGSQPFEDLLMPAIRGGERVHEPPALADLQARTRAQLELLHPSVRRFLNPHRYPAGLEERLHTLREDMLERERHMEER